MNTPIKKPLNLVAQDKGKDKIKVHKGKIYAKVYNTSEGDLRRRVDYERR